MSTKFVFKKLIEGIKRSRLKRRDVRLPITRGMLKTLLLCLACPSHNMNYACLELHFHSPSMVYLELESWQLAII